MNPVGFGRRLLVQVATVVMPDTILHWHRELVARKWTYRAGGGRPVGLQAHLRALLVRMGTENPTWGYTRIQGALKNLGTALAARRLPAFCARRHSVQSAAPHDVEDVPSGAWPALVAAVFFTTEVWSVRGLVTY